MALLSLLCAAGAASAWLYSYQRQGWVQHTRAGPSRCYSVALANWPGRVGLSVDWQAANAGSLDVGGSLHPPLSARPRWQTYSGEAPRVNAYEHTLPDRPDVMQFAGIAWYSGRSSTNGWSVLVPHRYVVLVAAALPLRWVWLRWRAKRRTRRMACLLCGYDLRATPDRCPECGSIPRASAEVAA